MFDEIIKRIIESKSLYFFFDYDGTLTSIRPTPEQAVLSVHEKNLLKTFSEYYPAAIVTGRRLNDIKPLVDINTISYIGNHGIEIEYSGNLWIDPEALQTEKIINELAFLIRSTTKDISGILVEDKTFSASVHYRLVDENYIPYLHEIIDNHVLMHSHLVSVTKGKKVMEIKSKLVCNKGTAIQKFFSLNNLEPDTTAIFFGDDETDEDAFRCLNHPHITIHVGTNDNTCAMFKVKDVKTVWEIIKVLVERAMLSN